MTASHPPLSVCLPFWDALTPEQQERLSQASACLEAAPGTVIHQGGADCAGVLRVVRGRLRAYILSEEGREMTLFRLLEGDLCLFSASCMLHGMQMDLSVEAEEPTLYWRIPAAVYGELMQASAAVAAFSAQLMARRFGEVMALMDQVLSKRMDARLAALLLQERTLQGGDTLAITQERLAHHLGSAREVVTRTLKYLQGEGCLTPIRGGVQLTDIPALQDLAQS